MDIADDLEGVWQKLVPIWEPQVSLSTRQRVNGCVADLVAFYGVVMDAARAQQLSFESHPVDLTPEEYSGWWARKSRTVIATSHRFAAVVKAAFYFTRALQDALYAVVLEIERKRPGPYSSMWNCAKSSAAAGHAFIANALPEYFPWFKAHRDTRNQMKLGTTTAAQYSVAERRLQVNVHRIESSNGSTVLGIAAEVSLDDITEGYRKSIELIRAILEVLSAPTGANKGAGSTETG